MSMEARMSLSTVSHSRVFILRMRSLGQNRPLSTEHRICGRVNCPPRITPWTRIRHSRLSCNALRLIVIKDAHWLWRSAQQRVVAQDMHASIPTPTNVLILILLFFECGHYFPELYIIEYVSFESLQAWLSTYYGWVECSTKYHILKSVLYFKHFYQDYKKWYM